MHLCSRDLLRTDHVLGPVILLVPMLRGIMVDCNLAIPLEERGKIYNKLKTSPGLMWTSSLLNISMSPIIIAKVGQRDFAATQGLTTSLFLFARIHGHGIKVLGIFIATTSATNLL